MDSREVYWKICREFLKMSLFFRRDIDRIRRCVGRDSYLVPSDTKVNLYIIVVGNTDVMASENLTLNTICLINHGLICVILINLCLI